LTLINAPAFVFAPQGGASQKSCGGYAGLRRFTLFISDTDLHGLTLLLLGLAFCGKVFSLPVRRDAKGRCLSRRSPSAFIIEAEQITRISLTQSHKGRS